MRIVKSEKQIRKCLPQLLKSVIFFPIIHEKSIFLLFPDADKTFFPLNEATASLRMTIDGPSGMVSCG